MEKRINQLQRKCGFDDEHQQVTCTRKKATKRFGSTNKYYFYWRMTSLLFWSDACTSAFLYGESALTQSKQWYSLIFFIYLFSMKTWTRLCCVGAIQSNALSSKSKATLVTQYQSMKDPFREHFANRRNQSWSVRRLRRKRRRHARHSHFHVPHIQWTVTFSSWQGASGTSSWIHGPNKSQKRQSFDSPPQSSKREKRKRIILSLFSKGSHLGNPPSQRKPCDLFSCRQKEKNGQRTLQFFTEVGQFKRRQVILCVHC